MTPPRGAEPADESDDPGGRDDAEDHLGTFLDELEDLDVPWTVTDPGAIGETVAEEVVEPAVGTRLREGDPPEGVTLDPTPAELRAARTGVTDVEFAIADYGSVVVRADGEGTEQVSLFVDRHVAVLRASTVLPDMPRAFERFGEVLRGDRDSAIIATGPSATADMGSLVRGAHGPKEVHVVVVEDRDGEER